jgi:hypothetical protein
MMICKELWKQGAKLLEGQEEASNPGGCKIPSQLARIPLSLEGE